MKDLNSSVEIEEKVAFRAGRNEELERKLKDLEEELIKKSKNEKIIKGRMS